MLEYMKIKEVVDQSGIGSFVCKTTDEVLSKDLPVGILLHMDEEDNVVFDLVGCKSRGRRVVVGYWVDRKGDRFCKFDDEESLSMLLDRLVVMFSLDDDDVRLDHCKKINRCRLKLQ